MTRGKMENVSALKSQIALLKPTAKSVDLVKKMQAKSLKEYSAACSQQKELKQELLGYAKTCKDVADSMCNDYTSNLRKIRRQEEIE